MERSKHHIILQSSRFLFLQNFLKALTSFGAAISTPSLTISHKLVTDFNYKSQTSVLQELTMHACEYGTSQQVTGPIIIIDYGVLFQMAWIYSSSSSSFSWCSQLFTGSSPTWPAILIKKYYFYGVYFF